MTVKANRLEFLTEDGMSQSSSKLRLSIGLAVFLVVESVATLSLAQPTHNVILFIPDGLRLRNVTPQVAPTFARVRDQGMCFANSHSVFPTLTMVNAAAIGTGHFRGDTGWVAFCLKRPKTAPTFCRR